MKNLRILLEKWEHPFTGKDYHFDDTDATDNEQNDTAYNNIAKLHDSLADHYHVEQYPTDDSNELTDLHRVNRKRMESIRSYTGSGYQSINKRLLKNNGRKNALGFQRRPYDDDYDHKWREQSYNNVTRDISNIDHLVKSFRTPHDMHVYSGVKFDPLQFHQGNKVMKVRMPAFTSTSLRPDKAEYFTGDSGHHWSDPEDEYNDKKIRSYNILKIHVPQGSRGMYVGHYSGSMGEREFILPRNSKLHIHHEPQIIDASDHDRERNLGDISIKQVWHAKLVHDGTDPTRHMNEDSDVTKIGTAINPRLLKYD